MIRTAGGSFQLPGLQPTDDDDDDDDDGGGGVGDDDNELG